MLQLRHHKFIKLSPKAGMKSGWKHYTVHQEVKKTSTLRENPVTGSHSVLCAAANPEDILQ